MTAAQSVADLIGEPLPAGSLGVDQDDPGLIAGYIPERNIDYLPPTQIGDGLAGPDNVQLLFIGRDRRPLAVDELGMQGPFVLMWTAIARHRAGRSFPYQDDFSDGIDLGAAERAPIQDALRPAVFTPGMLPPAHAGEQPVELTPNARTVYYTASPDVGWDGY